MLAASSLGTSFAQLRPNVVPQGSAETEAPLTAFVDSINRIFQGVDKSRVPSGIFEEYGLQYIDHTPFTGTTGPTTANQLDINRWRALYGDLYGARINANSAAMPLLAVVNQQLCRYAGDANVELPILHFNYHSVRTDAISSGAIRSTNNRLYDVAGQNPYQLNTAFAVAASSAALLKATASFVFRPDLFCTNTGRTVATLQVDFADGIGLVSMSWNVPRVVSYTAAGAKDVQVRVGYTDGSTWQSHLQVVAPAPTLVAAARYSGTSSLQAFSLIADKAYLGQKDTALITVEYGGRNKATPDPAVLDKPLIVVKGFDASRFFPDNIQHTTHADFAKSITTKESQGILSDGADLDGYDIVYVDFNNGTDYIQRNAYVLEHVIRWVNENKTGTQPNAMLSESMGGLVAHYALRDIETAGSTANNAAYPHQVRLLITHDSPHQGANVPLSIQLAVRHLAGASLRIPIGSDIQIVDRYPALGKARDALLSPAAQQLLRYQTTRATGLIFGGIQYVGPVMAAETSLYDTFQQEYQALLGPTGVPVGTPGRPCRVVASANGSECGRGQPFAPYAELVGISYNDSYLNFPLLDGLTLTGTIGSAAGLGVIADILSGPAAIIGAGVLSVFVQGLTGAYDLEAEFHLNALPDHQVKQIYSVYAQISKRTRLFGLFRVQFTLISFQRNSLASELPIDSGSGSIIPLANYAQQLGGAGAASTLPAGLIKVSQFCFVPTYSALNITPSSSNALTAEYSPSVITGSPFANFRTAARENEPHIQYTALNSTWMLKELEQTPQVLNCQSFCQFQSQIGGPTVVCTGGSTYTLAGVPAGVTVAWSLDTTVPFTITASSNTVYTVAAGGTGTDTVRATLSSACGQLALALPVVLGTQFRLSADRSQPCTLYLTVVAPGYTNLNLNTSTNGDQSVVDGSRIPVQYENRQVVATLTGSNACTGQTNTVSATYTQSGTAICPLLVGPKTAATAAPAVPTMYPNTANNYVDIRFESPVAAATA